MAEMAIASFAESITVAVLIRRTWQEHLNSGLLQGLIMYYRLHPGIRSSRYYEEKAQHCMRMIKNCHDLKAVQKLSRLVREYRATADSLRRKEARVGRSAEAKERHRRQGRG